MAQVPAIYKRVTWAEHCSLPPDLQAMKDRLMNMVQNQPEQATSKIPHKPHQRAFLCALRTSAAATDGT
jgi:hypothetical protein